LSSGIHLGSEDGAVPGGDVIAGNFIGTDVTGTVARPNAVSGNGRAGIRIVLTTIGGTAPAAPVRRRRHHPRRECAE
jgi:hypothetical protein